MYRAWRSGSSWWDQSTTMTSGPRPARSTVSVQRVELGAGAKTSGRARLSRACAPHKRPHYAPIERMAILELRAARAWSAKQTADAFLVTAATIAFWMKCIDEEGSDALVQIREPVNEFPELVRHTVQRFKILCPALGRLKIAQILCRSPWEVRRGQVILAARTFGLSRPTGC